MVEYVKYKINYTFESSIKKYYYQLDAGVS